MAIKVISAGSTSANYFVHVRHSDAPGNTSVSAGLANERTLSFRVPIESRDVRITVAGDFASGSTSSQIAIDIGPKGSAYVNLFSVSTEWTSVIPIQVDHVLRFRHVLNSAVASTHASINVWVG